MLPVMLPDDIDFSNPDSPIWIFEMSQWLNNIIPKNTTDIYDQKLNKQNKYCHNKA